MDVRGDSMTVQHEGITDGIIGGIIEVSFEMNVFWQAEVYGV